MIGMEVHSSAAADHIGRLGDIQPAPMIAPWGQLPPMPEVGRPESYYARAAKRADELDNPHAKEAAKVGQYLTLALDGRLEWEQKLRYFRHAIRAHCQAPPLARDEVWMFYGQLADLVRQYAGEQAVRLASQMDDAWAGQLSIGIPREQIRAEAQAFFRRLVGDTDHCPDFLNRDDWEQIRILKTQWV